MASGTAKTKKLCRDVQIGEKFGLLTVTKLPWPERRKKICWFCECSCACGTTNKRIWVQQLLCVGTVSCGCEKKRVHQSVAFKGRGK